MDIDELTIISTMLGEVAARTDRPEFHEKLQKLVNATDELAACWSGSNLGYHSTVYYAGFVAPPAGAHFSAEWGIDERFGIDGTTGHWREFKFDDVTAEIYRRAEDPDLDPIFRASTEAKEQFDKLKEDVISILTSSSLKLDSYLEGKKKEVERLRVLSADQVVKGWLPNSAASRDSLAVYQGIRSVT